MKRLILSLFAAIIFSTNVNAGNCDREPRTIPFNKKPMLVNLAPNEQVEVTFPESLIGVLPESPDGLIWHRTPFKEKLIFSTSNTTYSGNFIAHGSSGISYILRFQGKPDCADIAITIDEHQIVDMSKVKHDSKGRKMSLLEYMLKGEIPPGYYHSMAKGKKIDRLISKIGTVNWYLHETFEGPKYIGTVVQVENKGRTPYRVAIEKINYQSKSLRRVFGKVREVTMLPLDRRLAPHPEYVSDVAAGHNEGLIFIVSEKGGTFGE